MPSNLNHCCIQKARKLLSQTLSPTPQLCLGVLTPQGNAFFSWKPHIMDKGGHQSLNVVFTGHFCLEWWSNFVGSESGQKQGVKLLQNMVYSTIQHPPPPPATHCLYTVYCTVHLVWEGWWGGQREGRGATVHKYSNIVPSSMGATAQKLGQKYQPLVNVSSVYNICQIQCRKVR